jgi:hypothetical protein
MFIFLALILFAVLILFRYYEPRIKGGIGEHFVNERLSSLDPAHYRILNDLLLPSLGNTKTTQIDHVVVSNFGIFCIETKNYEGWIFGNAHQDDWTQVIYRSKHRFYNPIHQNFAHIKAIEALIRPLFPDAPIYPYIAFPSADKLKISGADYVGTAGDMIRKIQSLTQPVFSDADRDKIFDILAQANIIDGEERKKHIQDARFMKDSREF